MSPAHRFSNWLALYVGKTQGRAILELGEAGDITSIAYHYSYRTRKKIFLDLSTNLEQCYPGALQ